MSSRFVLVGICAWISLCLLIAGWLPDASDTMATMWMISGLMGLVSAVGLAETIKADMRVQETLINEYIHAAMTDALTGVANRHSLDRTLTSMLAESISRRTPFSMVMMDIDHFKAFNDQWGHQAGDAVLRCVSQRIAEFFRNRAFVARYGGEEFAVLLPGCRLRDADGLAEECRNVVRNTRCEFRDNVFQVTVSSGVAEASDLDTPESLIRRADLAMYAAKKMGGDSIWAIESNGSSSPVPSSNLLAGPTISGARETVGGAAK